MEENYINKLIEQTKLATSLEHLCPKQLFYINGIDIFVAKFEAIVPFCTSKIVFTNSKFTVLYKFDDDIHFNGLISFKNNEYIFEQYSGHLNLEMFDSYEDAVSFLKDDIELDISNNLIKINELRKENDILNGRLNRIIKNSNEYLNK